MQGLFRKIVLLISILIVLTLIFSQVKFLTVIGKSMEPTITQNDVIVVSPSDYKVGDVIAYRHEVEGKQYLFAHRVIKIHGDTIETKGDALEKPDEYVVKKSDVVGKVLFKIPMLGAFIRFAASTAGYVIFILIPSITLIAIEARKLRSYRSKKI
jgi:signal peptidase